MRQGIRMRMSRICLSAAMLLGTALPLFAGPHNVIVPYLVRPEVLLPTGDTAQRKHFTDLKLVNHQGKEVRFFSDVLKDKVVLINFIFTHCEDTCPLHTRKLAMVQKLLGDHIGRDIFLVSISVDPRYDTPQVLKEYAQEYRARDGWTFLTGDKSHVDWVIYRLGQYNKDHKAHSPLFFLANVKKGRWNLVRGDTPPTVLAEQLRHLLTDG